MSDQAKKEIRHLTVLGRYGYDSIPTITQFVAEAARASQLDEDAVFHCQMAVDEACTNVVEHAYGGKQVDNIEVTCWVEPGTCTIQVIDHGEPFDPDKVPVPKISTNLDEIKPGGIGLHLMRQLMDEVRFEFGEQGNILTMTKTGTTGSAETLRKSEGIEVRKERDAIWVVSPRGHLDAGAVPDLESALTKLSAQGHFHTVVDMTQVTYISSRGLKTLVSAWRRAQDKREKLVLCGVAPRVQAIFDTIGFNQIFNIYVSLDEALAALSGQSA